MGPSVLCIFNLFNCLFLVIGLFFGGLGVMMVFFPGNLWADVYGDVKDHAEGAPAGYSIPSSAAEFGSFSFFVYIGAGFLAMGGLMSIASFLAFLGAQCANQLCCKKCLVTYSVFVVILVVSEVTLGVMLYVMNSPLHNQVKSGFQSHIEDDYEENGADSFSKALNVVQRYYDCCGMDDAEDFGVKGHASCDVADEQKGCYTKLQKFFHTDLFPAGLAAFCLLQMLSLYCAVTLYKENSPNNMNKVEPISFTSTVPYTPSTRPTTTASTTQFINNPHTPNPNPNPDPNANPDHRRGIRGGEGQTMMTSEASPPTSFRQSVLPSKTVVTTKTNRAQIPGAKETLESF